MKTQKRVIKFLERKEVEKLIDSIEGEGYRNTRDRALIEVLWETGLRIAEALALPDAIFTKEVTKDTLELSIIGKGGWARTVYFSPRVVRAIKAYLATRKDSDTRLFPFTIRCAQQIVARRVKLAGIEKRVTPHTFRHSFGTHILRKGANLRLAQEMLGHRSITSTQVYTHITSPELKAAHKRFFG